MRVEELAGKAGVSVDTVRFYQKQRLLPPPVREGRVAWYTAEHLARMARVKELRRRGFRVTTNTTFFDTDSPQDVIDVLNYLNDDLQVDQMMISPGYAYEKAPDQDHFLAVRQTRELFRKAFANGNRNRWRLNHSPMFLDFLEGKVDFQCTPWGIPCYTIFGWQRPCYLQSDGHVATYRELVEETDWSKYGRDSGNPQCRNCMAHCGYEPTAVMATSKSLKQSLRAMAMR